jgi:photosystem II stability/assembly factor-like uncharacterized protein
MARSKFWSAFAFGTLAFSCAFATGPLANARGAQTSKPDYIEPKSKDELAIQAMEWRNVGPFRGGRATTITGVPSQPLVYYMGSTGGGVWKTEDGGGSWHNVSDGFMKMGSVGSIAVSVSDPNVVYVGMGEAPVRGQSSSFGDGMYKSTDAGKTWTHIGLENTRQISKVLVHPRDENLVYVAAQGSRWAPTDDRGVYRSADGGKSWTKILFVDRTAGPSDMAMDATNPRVLYVGFWDHQRTPWQMRSGGPRSGIWKTTDGGDHWTQLTEGLPKVMGKIGIGVSPANSDRVYANIEADEGGLYRSDDAGKTWHLSCSDRVIRARAWYYTVVTPDPKSADVVYVINAPVEKSIDGGKTFQPLPAPHGDNHALWINPNNPLNMANANDGGADVTFDGGKTWSTQMNQPTAQFYRVEVDDLFPYNLYAGQQDNTPVKVPSRVNGPGIDRQDWKIVGGGESASFAFDPKNPRYIYGTGYQGGIEETDTQTNAVRDIMEWPALGLAEPSDLQKYRFNWHAPVATSPFDRKVIYHGGNVVFESADRGNTWKVISPDLTRNDKAHQGLGGVPFTNEGAGGEVYGTIYYIAPSPHEQGTIWVGTDDGYVQLTRDGGKTWTNVTPKGLAEGQVNAIEVSPADAGTAYFTFTRFKFDDNTPHIFKTSDYGKTWNDLAGGLPQDMPARVVREDPKHKGLLFAGTENAAWYSLDAGHTWKSLQSNLPRVPVTDLKVHDGDLVASTEGRAFWILDDIRPLEVLDDRIVNSDFYLFAPQTTYMLPGGGFSVPSGAPLGKNPPNGAVFRYILGTKPEDSQELKLEIADPGGAVIRSYSSKPKPGEAATSPFPGAPAPSSQLLPTKQGMNQFVWDLRSDSPVRVPGIYDPQAPQGYRVAPGTYKITLTLGAKKLTESVELAADPSLPPDEREDAAAVAASKTIHERINAINRAMISLRGIRDQLNSLEEHNKDRADFADLGKSIKSINGSIDSIEARLLDVKQKTQQDEVNFRHGLADQYAFLESTLEGAPLTVAEKDRLAELDKEWSDWQTKIKSVNADVASFNARARDKGIPVISSAESH